MTTQEMIRQHRQEFETYCALLQEWNEKFNLTTITKTDDIFEKHFADSLQGADLLTGGTLCDVGSGAGFPGMPLKIVRPEMKVTLMDSVGKKIVFLEEINKQLGLDCVCLKLRAEDAAHGKYREQFDTVTSRAVARLNVLLEYCLPLVKKGGRFLAYKGQADEEIKESDNALSVLGGKILESKEYTLQGGEKRQIIVVEKTKNTPKEFPRGLGKERKNPL